MPPLRPLVRHFPRPNGAASRSPYLVSMMATPTSQQTSSASLSGSRTFASTSVHLSGGDTHYEPPGGWLFGVPPGEKYKKEGWENIWVWGFWGSLTVTVIAYAYKPDTSIQTWALEEARRRLEAEGILPDPQAKN